MIQYIEENGVMYRLLGNTLESKESCQPETTRVINDKLYYLDSCVPKDRYYPGFFSRLAGNKTVVTSYACFWCPVTWSMIEHG